MPEARAVTALVLAAALVATLYLVPPPGLAVLLGALVVAGAGEWGMLTTRSATASALFMAVVAFCLLLLYLRDDSIPYLLHVAIAWWLVAALRLRGPLPALHTAAGRAAALLDGLFYLVPGWAALMALHGAGQRGALVLVPLVLCWIADTVAYFAGRRCGRHRLAPRLSPGKSWEGAGTAAAAVVLAALPAGILLLPGDAWTQIAWMALCLFTFMLSVVGDLFESRLKRAAGVKDSGQILPGHGGVLDRIDSAAAAAPVFALGWLTMFDPLV